MIDLPLRIRTELSGSTFSLNPLIVIDVNRIDNYANNSGVTGDYSDKIYISANKQSFPLEFDQNGNTIISVFWHDRVLKLGSIKESIDVINKNFKINNVSINLSNDVIGSNRFSDVVSEKNIINKNIQIYYQTPSARSLQNCILVYSGIVTKIRHDFKKFKIECEDLTQYKLSTKFPKANMGFGNHIISDDYKNRSIPVVYGEIDKAPCLLMREPTASTDEDYETFAICDDVLNDSRQINLAGFGGDTLEASFLLTNDNANCPLFIYKGEN